MTRPRRAADARCRLRAGTGCSARAENGAPSPPLPSPRSPTQFLLCGCLERASSPLNRGRPSYGRKTVDPIGSESQRLDRMDAAQRQVPVQMGKKRAAARWLPFERRAERRRLDRDQQEVVLAGKMPSGGFAHLLGGGEMDVAVG